MSNSPSSPPDAPDTLPRGARVSDYDYDLPESRIAQHAVEPRDASRLMVVDRATGTLSHRTFRDVLDLIPAGDALVLNTEGSVVYQVEQHGEELKVNRVPVTVLFGDSRQVAVSGALKQGDRVVVRGAGSLQDGDKVELFRG